MLFFLFQALCASKSNILLDELYFRITYSESVATIFTAYLSASQCPCCQVHTAACGKATPR